MGEETSAENAQVYPLLVELSPLECQRLQRSPVAKDGVCSEKVLLQSKKALQTTSLCLLWNSRVETILRNEAIDGMGLTCLEANQILIPVLHVIPSPFHPTFLSIKVPKKPLKKYKKEGNLPSTPQTLSANGKEINSTQRLLSWLNELNISLQIKSSDLC